MEIGLKTVDWLHIRVSKIERINFIAFYIHVTMVRNIEEGGM